MKGNINIVLGIVVICILSQELWGQNYATDSIKLYLENLIKSTWDISNKYPDSALIITNNAIEMTSSEAYLMERAELLRLKGVIYFYKVDYAGALSYFIQSRDINREINNRAGESSALNNISLVYRRQGFKEKALEMDLEILQMRHEIGDSSRIAQSLNNLAVSYHDIGKQLEALEYYRKAEKLSKAINDSSSFDLYYNNIGVIFTELNQPDSAYYYFNKSLNYSRQTNDWQMTSNSLNYLGNFYLSKNMIKKAIQNYQQSLALAKEIGIVYEIESAAEGLHKAYAAMGDFEKAYATHLLFKKMADSANNEETMQKITEIESQTKFEKEKEIEQLSQHNKDIQNQLKLTRQKQINQIAFILIIAAGILMFTLYRNFKRKSILSKKLMLQRDEIMAQKEEIETQRDEIEELNHTKDKFFTIIAHDLKNPISGVYRLSELIADNIKSIDETKLQEYIQQIHLSTKKTYELLENLLRWAMVQTGSIQIEPTEFNLTTVIQESIDLLTENAKQKNIGIKFPYCTDCIALADEKMITTVVRNLLHNAIKFSPDNSVINFDINLESNFWRVSVSDNGIGIDPDHQVSIFELNNKGKSMGTSKEKGTGLGLILCKEFIELNSGKIWLDSSPEQGTTFYFTVPAN